MEEINGDLWGIGLILYQSQGDTSKGKIPIHFKEKYQP